MTTSYWQLGPRHGAAIGSYDVAVIGGGIAGCATAFWLGRLRPAIKVAVVEAREIASGASGRNAGFILKGAAVSQAQAIERYGRERARRLWDFTEENSEVLSHELDAREFDYCASGAFTEAGTPEEDRLLRLSVSELRRDGVACEYFDPAETARRRRRAQRDLREDRPRLGPTAGVKPAASKVRAGREPSGRAQRNRGGKEDP